MPKVFVAYRNESDDGSPSQESKAARSLFDTFSKNRIAAAFSNEGLLKRSEDEFIAAAAAEIALSDMFVAVICGNDSLSLWPELEVRLFSEMIATGKKRAGSLLFFLADGAKAPSGEFGATAFRDITSLVSYIKKPDGASAAAASKGELTEKDGILYEVHSGFAAAAGAVGNESSIAIASNVEGVPVEVIAPSAFRGRKELTSVTLPETLTEICDFAFADCVSLEGIGLPAELKRIGNEAFSGDTAFRHMYVPFSVTSVGCKAFDSTPWLTSQRDDFVTIGDGVLIKYQGGETSVKLPSGIKYVCAAFYGSDTVTDVMLGRNIRVLDDWAFAFSAQLRWLSLSDGLDRIGCFAFCGCASLEGITIPETVRVIDSYAFQNCGELMRVSVAGEPKVIGDLPFDGCPIVELRVKDGTPLSEYAEKNGIKHRP